MVCSCSCSCMSEASASDGVPPAFSQVTLLDFGASRGFSKEFTDNYIEVRAAFLPGFKRGLWGGLVGPGIHVPDVLGQGSTCVTSCPSPLRAGPGGESCC